MYCNVFIYLYKNYNCNYCFLKLMNVLVLYSRTVSYYQYTAKYSIPDVLIINKLKLTLGFSVKLQRIFLQVNPVYETLSFLK